MKRISLRKFRDSVADIHETVEVQRRDADGNHQVLGRWQPFMLDVPGSTPLTPAEDCFKKEAWTEESHRMSQAERDAILRKVNKG